MYGRSSYGRGDGGGSHGESFEESFPRKTVAKRARTKTFKSKQPLRHNDVRKSAKKLNGEHGFAWGLAKGIFKHGVKYLSQEYFGYNPETLAKRYLKGLAKKHLNPWLEKTFGIKPKQKGRKPRVRKVKPVSMNVPSPKKPSSKPPSNQLPSAPKIKGLLPA